LAISPHGDLIFAANRDLAGVSGIDLINQRIRTRLRLHRGSWVYDADGSLGSNLFQLIGKASTQAAQLAPAYVREALRDMPEIQVDDVSIEQTERDISLTVVYRVVASPEEVGGAAEAQYAISVTLNNDTFGSVE
jgi:phage baseplate assembly protein W